MFWSFGPALAQDSQAAYTGRSRTFLHCPMSLADPWALARIWTAWDSGSSNRWMGPWYSLAMVLSTSCWGRVFLGKKTSILRVLSLRTRRTWKPINIGGFYPLRQNKRIEGQQRRERSSKLAKLADYYFALLSLARVSLEAQTRVQGVFFSRPAWRTPDHGSQRHHPPAGTKRSGRCWGNSEVALLCSQGYLVPATVNLFNRPSRPIRGV